MNCSSCRVNVHHLLRSPLWPRGAAQRAAGITSQLMEPAPVPPECLWTPVTPLCHLWLGWEHCTLTRLCFRPPPSRVMWTSALCRLHPFLLPEMLGLQFLCQLPAQTSISTSDWEGPLSSFPLVGMPHILFVAWQLCWLFWPRCLRTVPGKACKPQQPRAAWAGPGCSWVNCPKCPSGGCGAASSAGAPLGQLLEASSPVLLVRSDRDGTKQQFRDWQPAFLEIGFLLSAV